VRNISISISFIRTSPIPADDYIRFLPHLREEERERALRFVFSKDRLAFTLGRLLVHRALAEHGAAPPGGWRFQLNAYGRPELPPESGVPGFRFSITHCAGLVAVAHSLVSEVGLDAEPGDRGCSDLAIARSYFSPQEFRTLEAAPSNERGSVFLNYWTLKEAYIKARGMGLSIPLSDFSFTLDPLGVEFSRELGDDAGRWYFWRGSPAAGYQMALAATRVEGQDPVVSWRELLPQSLS
jgi:4'-phosphopantetheinyl transferase